MLPLIAFGPLCILKELQDDRACHELRDQVARQNRRLFMFQTLAFYCPGQAGAALVDDLTRHMPDGMATVPLRHADSTRAAHKRVEAESGFQPRASRRPSTM